MGWSDIVAQGTEPAGAAAHSGLVPSGKLRLSVTSVEPPPSRWLFPSSVEEIAAATGEGEVFGVGADLEPGTLLAAYRHGLFPDARPAGRGGVVVAGSAGHRSPATACG